MGKTAVITGARQIGAAYAKRLATDGFDLIITGRRREIIQKLADNLVAQHRVRVSVIIAELSDDNDFQKVVDAIRATEDIEMLINNAGYSGYPGHFVETDMAEHEKMVKVHQIVPMRLISLVGPQMIESVVMAPSLTSVRCKLFYPYLRSVYMLAPRLSSNVIPDAYTRTQR